MPGYYCLLSVPALRVLAWAGSSNPGGPPLAPDTSVPATYGGTATFGNQFASPHIIWVHMGGQGGAFGGIGGAVDVSGYSGGSWSNHGGNISPGGFPNGPDGPGGSGEPSGYTVIIGGNYGIW